MNENTKIILNDGMFNWALLIIGLFFFVMGLKEEYFAKFILGAFVLFLREIMIMMDIRKVGGRGK